MALLGLVQYVDGVVGAEHHAHVLCVIMQLLHFVSQRLCVGGGRILQFMHEHLQGVIILSGLSLLLADLTVGADGEAAQGNGTFLCPFGQGLGKKRQTGYEKPHPLAGPCHGFGNLEAGEGLAGTAGHD